jgi:hypothetical protein
VPGSARGDLSVGTRIDAHYHPAAELAKAPASTGGFLLPNVDRPARRTRASSNDSSRAASGSAALSSADSTADTDQSMTPVPRARSAGD